MILSGRTVMQKGMPRTVSHCANEHMHAEIHAGKCDLFALRHQIMKLSKESRRDDS